jgi:hypothetical protein
VHVSRWWRAAAGVALAACGSPATPAQSVANTAAATPRTPLADAKEACATLAARATGPGVDIAMDGFSAEGGQGQVVSTADGTIAAVRGRLLGESGRVDVEIYYAGEEPVCSTVIHARYAPPPDDSASYGDVDHVDTIRRYYVEGALVGTEVNGEIVSAADNATWVEDDAQEQLENARGELAKTRAAP